MQKSEILCTEGRARPPMREHDHSGFGTLPGRSVHLSGREVWATGLWPSEALGGGTGSTV